VVNPSHPRSAHRRAVYRRRRLGVLAGVISLAAVVYFVVAPGGSNGARHPQPASAGTARTADPPIPAMEAGVLPWTLPSPLSREVVIPGGGSTLTVAGGLDPAQHSATTVFSLDVTTGNRTVDGTLASGVHDAAAAVIAGSVAVLGGGSPTTVPTVQQFPAAPGAGAPAPPPSSWAPPSSAAAAPSPPVSVPGNPPVVITGTTATTTSPSPISTRVAANLPRPRSDHVAVTIGSTTYVLGGYDGNGPDPDIWATTDGIHYSVVAHLAMSVRYAAVAVADNRVYLFGGQAVGGPQDGTAIPTAQMFDPSTKRTAVIGNLAEPLAGASAFNLGGHLYIAGGVTNTAPATPGSAIKISDTPTDAISAWDTKTNQPLSAGKLPLPIAYAGSAVTFGRGWIIGGEIKGRPQTSVEMLMPNPRFGTAGTPGAGSPYFGYKLLIADRGNDRLLVLTPGDQVIWGYPSVFAAAPPGGFYFPDDAFFAKGGTEIISNQERNHTLVIISFPDGRVLWQYGHPLSPGSAPGYLSWPDDAYILKDGEVTVADDRNCRILFINPDKAIASQIAQTGNCTHNPPTGLAEPNGDTPLTDGNYLVSEINGQWISEYTKTGQLVWSTHLPIHYPSDPQQLGADLYLVSDYAIAPGGAIDEFNREGQILYRLQPSQGLSRMNQPSLTELLPSGVFMTNDDYRDRMVAFDPPTGALVWQYGNPDTPGTGPGYLNTPDGFDLLAPDGTTPTHPATG
jgi:putative pyrroloquinoline-quinone binding quinoprotein/Kelch motif protein